MAACLVREFESFLENKIKVIVIIYRTNDDKLIVLKDGKNYSNAIKTLAEFQTKYFK